MKEIQNTKDFNIGSSRVLYESSGVVSTLSASFSTNFAGSIKNLENYENI